MEGGSTKPGESKSSLVAHSQPETCGNNGFSIDRTFSATSTDIQPSFDVFDDSDDDSRSRADGCSNKKKKSGGKFSASEKGNSSRADMYRKEMMAYHRAHRIHEDILDHHYYQNSKSKTSQTHHSPQRSERGNVRREERNKSFYLEGEDSIGVPSDISGMLHDSEEEEDDNPEKNCESHATHKEIPGRAEFLVAGDSDYNNGPGNLASVPDGHINGHSAAQQENGANNNNNNTGLMRSSVISDGRFGSVKSVSSSFNSAAAAACGGGGGGGGGSAKFGMGIMATGAPNNNNDILNERLERFHRYTRGPYAPLDRCNSTSVSSAHSSTITQHYYPESGWGYVVLATAAICHALMCGLHLSSGVFLVDILGRFGEDLVMSSGNNL